MSNRDHGYARRRRRRKNKRSIFLKDLLQELFFYGMLILLLLIFLMVKARESSGPRMLGGFSAFVVLSGSMEEEIPKGALVITRQTDPRELCVGDDITYMANASTTITHRIVGIEENYQDTGERAFQTQGIMNTLPDQQLVPAVNVVGKVIFHNKPLGVITTYVQENWPLLVFFLFVLLIFEKVIKRILQNEYEEK